MTIEEFFESERSKSFHMEDTYFKQILSETGMTPQLILESSILDNYQSILRQFIVRLPITDKFRDKYKYNPKKLAAREYDSTEYWFLILYANELYSASQFSLDKGYIYMYQKGIQQVINEIMNIERKYIQKNAASVSDFTKNAQ